MVKKRISNNKRHIDSLKKRTETKDFIDRMVATGIPVTKKAVMEGTGCSNGFVNNAEITAYIKQAQEKQRGGDLRVDIGLQNTILTRKLLSSYIFQYALLDEQETFLKEAIEELKAEKTEKVMLTNSQTNTAIKLLAMNLKNETDESKILSIIQEFRNAFEKDIPNWKEALIKILEENAENCVSIKILQSIE